MERRRLDAHTKNGTTQQHKALQPQNLQAYHAPSKINIDDWLFKPHIILNPRQAAARRFCAWPQFFFASTTSVFKKSRIFALRNLRNGFYVMRHNHLK
jgi:hypothetical protein